MEERVQMQVWDTSTEKSGERGITDMLETILKLSGTETGIQCYTHQLVHWHIEGRMRMQSHISSIDG